MLSAPPRTTKESQETTIAHSKLATLDSRMGVGIVTFVARQHEVYKQSLLPNSILCIDLLYAE